MLVVLASQLALSSTSQLTVFVVLELQVALASWPLDFIFVQQHSPAFQMEGADGEGEQSSPVLKPTKNPFETDIHIL